MTEISTQKIIEIHNRIIEKYGGTGGILISGTIDFLIFEYNQKDDVFEKAALILYRIIQGHPFTDGNKRTAFEVADLVLRGKEYHIHAEDQEILDFLLKIAKTNSDDCEVVLIKNWMKRKSRRLKKSRQLKLS